MIPGFIQWTKGLRSFFKKIVRAKDRNKIVGRTKIEEDEKREKVEAYEGVFSANMHSIIYDVCTPIKLSNHFMFCKRILPGSNLCSFHR